MTFCLKIRMFLNSEKKREFRNMNWHFYMQLWVCTTTKKHLFSPWNKIKVKEFISHNLDFSFKIASLYLTIMTWHLIFLNFFYRNSEFISFSSEIASLCHKKLNKKKTIAEQWKQSSINYCYTTIDLVWFINVLFLNKLFYWKILTKKKLHNFLRQERRAGYYLLMKKLYCNITLLIK